MLNRPATGPSGGWKAAAIMLALLIVLKFNVGHKWPEHGQLNGDALRVGNPSTEYEHSIEPSMPMVKDWPLAQHNSMKLVE